MGAWHKLRTGHTVCSACVSTLEQARIGCEAALTEAKSARPPLGTWNYVAVASVPIGIVAGVLTANLLESAFALLVFAGIFAVTVHVYQACTIRANQHNRPLLEVLEAKARACEENLDRATKRLSSLYEVYWDQPPDWAFRRSLVTQRAEGRCEQCGRRKFGSRVPFHVHHVVPRASVEGHHGLSNLRLLCEICHSKEPGSGHRGIATARSGRLRRARRSEA